MKKSFFIILVSICLKSFSQDDTISLINNKSAIFVYYYSGEYKLYNDIKLITPFLSDSYVEINGDKIAAETVKFFRNNDGLFANTFNLDGLNHFIPCEQEGKINVFSITKDYTHFNTSTGIPYNNSISKTYINKGFGNIEKATLKTIERYTEDNLESQMQIKKCRRFNRVVTFAALGGAAILLPSAIYCLSKGINPTPPVYIGGSILILVNFSWIFSPDKFKAIEIYNEK